MKNIEVSDSVRLLSGSYMTIDDYNEIRENASINTANDLFGDIVEIADSELPF